MFVSVLLTGPWYILQSGWQNPLIPLFRHIVLLLYDGTFVRNDLML
jgi:hypothetical protein